MNQFDTIGAQDAVSRLAQETTEEHDTTPADGDQTPETYNPAPLTTLAAQIRAEVDAELARREAVWTQHTAYLNETN